MTEITKAGKHAKLIAADVVGGSGGGHSHFHLNVYEYNGEYRYNEGRRYQSDLYRSNGVSALPPPSAAEQLQLNIYISLSLEKPHKNKVLRSLPTSILLCY